MRPSRKSIALVAAIAVLGMASASQADPIAYEPFDYTAGSSIGGNGVAGHSTVTTSSDIGISGNWNTGGTTSGGSNTVVTGISSSYALASANQAIQMDTVATNTTQSELSIPLSYNSLFPTDAGYATQTNHTLYIGFILQMSQNTVPGTADTGTAQIQLASLVNVGTKQSGTTYGFSPNSGSFSYAPGSDTNAAVSTLDALIVVELDYTGATSSSKTDTAELYVNPTSTDFTSLQQRTSSLTHGYDARETGLVLGGLTAAGTLEFLTTSTGDALSPIFDEVRIGTSYPDVIASPVPEPASLGLFGAIGAAALLRRRRGRLAAE